MMRAPSTLPLLIAFSAVIGLGLSFFLLFACLSDVEIACTIQMPAYRIGEAFGFGVHGGLYLIGLLLNALLLGALCFCGLFLVQRITRRKKST
jgi:hypothetical protein